MNEQKRRGRPKVYGSKSKEVKVRLSEFEMEQLRSVAELKKMSMSEAIRELINDYLMQQF